MAWLAAVHISSSIIIRGVVIVLRYVVASKYLSIYIYSQRMAHWYESLGDTDGGLTLGTIVGDTLGTTLGVNVG